MPPFIKHRPADFAGVFGWLIDYIFHVMDFYRDDVGAELNAIAFHRLSGLRKYFNVIAAKHAAGTLRPSVCGYTRAGANRPAGVRRPSIIPREFGWLPRRVPEYAGMLAHAVEELLATDAGMKALLAAAPQLVARFRPVCHMLGINPAVLPRRAPKTDSKIQAPAPSPAVTTATPTPAAPAQTSDTAEAGDAPPPPPPQANADKPDAPAGTEIGATGRRSGA